jgi:hypothetical protein
MEAGTLNKESREAFASTLWSVGVVLLLSYPITVFSSIIPPQPLDPAWQLNLITNLVDNGGIPLIGLLCIQAAAQFSPGSSPRQGIHATLANLSLGAIAGFLLLVPLQLVASLTLFENLKSDQVSRVERGSRRLASLSIAIAKATRAQDLQVELQKLDGLSLSQDDLALPLPRLKASLLERLGKAQRQLEAQLPPPGQQLSWPMIQASLRIVPTSLAYAFGFAAAGRRRGQRISLLDERRALNRQNARARQERRRSRQAFLQGVEEAHLEQTMLAQDDRSSAPPREDDQSQHQPRSAKNQAPLAPKERAGRQRGPVDLSYFEELSRVDEPAPPADESNDRPN